MSKTFNSSIADFILLTNDSSGTVLARTLLNMGTKKILGLSDWSFNKDLKTYSTGTNVQYYDSPYNASKIDFVHYWYGGRWFLPREVKSENDWIALNSVNVSSSLPTHWFVSERTKQVGLFPFAVDSKGTVRVGFTKRVIDLGVADYSTGSITASANGTIFTASNGTFESSMVGRYLSVGSTTTAINNFWFEISNFNSATSVSIKASIPNAVSNGTYVVSELIPLPDGFENIPLHFALENYFRVRENINLAREYERLYKEGMEELLKRDSRSVQGILEKQDLSMPYDVNSDPWRMGTIQ